MFKLFVLGAVVSAAIAGPAEAAVVDVTYTATVLVGSDGAGKFFAAGTDLAGKDLTITYRFDTAGVPVESQVPGGTDYSGGSLFSSVSPAQSATITFNGISVSFAGDQYGVLAEQSTAFYSFQSHQASADAGPYVYSSVSAGPGALPKTLLAPYTYTVQASDNAFGFFDLADDTSASFRPTFLRETVVSAVPLPAGLPLFALGLMALGVSGYGFKRKING